METHVDDAHQTRYASIEDRGVGMREDIGMSDSGQPHEAGEQKG